jgi:hypothetical protein
MRQEHPVPTGAELVKAHVRTVVAQYPPFADEIGVWYVEYGYPEYGYAAAAAPTIAPVVSPAAPNP